MTTPESIASNTGAPTPFWRHEDFPQQATGFNLEVDEMRAIFRQEAKPAVGNADTTTTLGPTS